MLGLQIAFPASIALLVTTLGLGLMARMIPEMNVFAVGFAVRTGVGMLALFMTLPFIADLFGAVVSTGLQGSQMILNGLGGN
jgi:flagellar biosynthetic protein FliR